MSLHYLAENRCRRYFYCDKHSQYIFDVSGPGGLENCSSIAETLKWCYRRVKQPTSLHIFDATGPGGREASWLPFREEIETPGDREAFNLLSRKTKWGVGEKENFTKLFDRKIIIKKVLLCKWWMLLAQ